MVYVYAVGYTLNCFAPFLAGNGVKKLARLALQAKVGETTELWWWWGKTFI